jgi:hypothetical protein
MEVELLLTLLAQERFGNLLPELWVVKVEIMTGLSRLDIPTMRDMLCHLLELLLRQEAFLSAAARSRATC